MRVLVLAVLVLISVILEGTVLHSFAIYGVKLDLLLIWVVLFAFLEGPVRGFKYGFLIGFVEDLVTGKFFGLHTLTKMITGFIIGTLEPKIFKENYLVPIVVVFLGTLLNELLYLLLGNIIGFDLSWSTGLRQVILPLSFYNSLAAPFLYVPLYKLYSRKWLKNED